MQLFVTPWTVAHQAPLSMEFSRKEYWSGWPFPSPGDRPNPGIRPRSPALQADSWPSEPPGKPRVQTHGGPMTTLLLSSLSLSQSTWRVTHHCLREREIEISSSFAVERSVMNPDLLCWAAILSPFFDTGVEEGMEAKEGSLCQARPDSSQILRREAEMPPFTCTSYFSLSRVRL